MASSSTGQRLTTRVCAPGDLKRPAQPEDPSPGSSTLGRSRTPKGRPTRRRGDRGVRSPRPSGFHPSASDASSRLGSRFAPAIARPATRSGLSPAGRPIGRTHAWRREARRNDGARLLEGRTHWASSPVSSFVSFPRGPESATYAPLDGSPAVDRTVRRPGPHGDAVRRSRRAREVRCRESRLPSLARPGRVPAVRYWKERPDSTRYSPRFVTSVARLTPRSAPSGTMNTRFDADEEQGRSDPRPVPARRLATREVLRLARAAPRGLGSRDTRRSTRGRRPSISAAVPRGTMRGGRAARGDDRCGVGGAHARRSPVKRNAE